MTNLNWNPRTGGRNDSSHQGSVYQGRRVYQCLELETKLIKLK